MFFYFINIKGLVGRAGGYPPDKICEIRYPSENPKNKKILIHIRPNMACGRAGGRSFRAVLSGGSGLTGFCPPLAQVIYWKLFRVFQWARLIGLINQIIN